MINVSMVQKRSVLVTINYTWNTTDWIILTVVFLGAGVSSETFSILRENPPSFWFYNRDHYLCRKIQTDKK